MLADVALQAAHTIRSDDEPKLQTSKSTTQWNAPVLKENILTMTLHEKRLSLKISSHKYSADKGAMAL